MDTQNLSPSRRELVRAGVAGLVAGPALLALNAPAHAQSASQPSGPQNPLDAYPKPPFPPQEQDPPGLTSKMTPRPDHGETSYVGSGKMTGRRAFITGGDSGIGRAAAIAFAREGADVALGYLPPEEPDAQEVVALIRAAGRKAVALPGDIRTEDVCNRLIADALEQLGGLDVLVLNAAQQKPVKRIEDLSSEQFDQVFKCNVYAPFWIAKAAVPRMPAGSSIIITSSIQAYDPSPSMLDYAQTKACNIVLAKALAKQLADRGIRVNAVAPGPFWTPLQPASGGGPDGIVNLGEATPLKRPGQPAELADAFVFLASNRASYVTGEVYGATGGGSPF